MPRGAEKVWQEHYWAIKLNQKDYHMIPGVHLFWLQMKPFVLTRNTLGANIKKIHKTLMKHKVNILKINSIFSSTNLLPDTIP